MATTRDTTPDTPPASATPPRWRLVATVVIMAVLGLMLGSAIGNLAKSSGVDFLGVRGVPAGQALAIVFASLWGVIAVHELGHLLAGLAQGNRFMLWAVGPVAITREGPAIRVRFNRRAELWGGVAATLPPSSADMRSNLLRVVAAGPVASLLLTIGALLLIDADAPAVRLAAITLAATSFGILLGTTLPARTGAFFTDGARIRMLLAGVADAERWMTVTALASGGMDGRPPAAWDATLLARADALADDSLDGLMLRAMVMQHAVAMGDAPRAARHGEALARVMDTLAEPLKSWMAYDLLTWQALSGGPVPPVAEVEALARRTPGLTPLGKARTLAAVHLGAGALDAARAQLAEGRRLAAAAPASESATEGALLDAIARALDARAAVVA